MKLGNTAHEGQCKRQRFKNIHIEAIDPTGSSPPSTIRIMTDEIINPKMDTMVDYTSSILNSFRSNTFDAIMIYGFGVGKASTGIVKAKVKILDGLSEWANWTPCTKSCGSGVQTGTRTCQYDLAAFQSAGGKLRKVFKMKGGYSAIEISE